MQSKKKFTCNALMSTLIPKLEVAMHGIQRVPALMYENPLKSLKLLQLDKYEIISTEPLHDVSNHIKNLYIELPSHIGENKKIFENIIDLMEKRLKQFRLP